MTHTSTHCVFECHLRKVFPLYNVTILAPVVRDWQHCRAVLYPRLGLPRVRVHALHTPMGDFDWVCYLHVLLPHIAGLFHYPCLQRMCVIILLFDLSGLFCVVRLLINGTQATQATCVMPGVRVC